MKAIPLAAEKRIGIGKELAKKLRAAGRVPGILYGEHTDPVSIELVERDLSAILRKASSEQILIDLTVNENGGEPQMALVRDVQHDPVTGAILHIDFLHISATKKIRVTVPIHIKGVPSGVKNFGGILQHILREVEVESLPADIPDMIDVDVSALEIGDALHVSGLAVEGVHFVTPADRTIVSVVPPTVIKEVTPVAEGAEGEAAEGEAAEGEGAEKAAEGEGKEAKPKETKGKEEK